MEMTNGQQDQANGLIWKYTAHVHVTEDLQSKRGEDPQEETRQLINAKRLKINFPPARAEDQRDLDLN